MLKNKLITVSAMLVLVLSMILTVGCKEKGTSIDIKDDNLDVSQTYFKSHQVAKGEKGYYFMEEMGKYLLYMDETTKEVIPLCSKAECTHSDKNCDANIRGAHFDYCIYYYNNKLYWLTNDSGMVKLMECAADGSGRKIIGELYPYNMESDEAELIFAGEYMYFTENGVTLTDKERSIFLKKMSLKDGTVKTVYEYSDINCAILRLRAYSGKVYFTITSVNKSDNDTFKTIGKGLFAIDVQSDKTEQVIKDDVRDYCIDTANKALYYYVFNEGLYVQRNTDTELIYKATEQTGYCELSYDGKYVYMDNTGWKIYSKHFMGLDYDITGVIWIYDNGVLKTSIDVKGQNFLAFFNGDEDYFFAQRKPDNDSQVKMAGVSFFSKKEFFETGKINWMKGDVK